MADDRERQDGADDDVPEPTLRETLEAARDEAIRNEEARSAREPIADDVPTGGRERDANGRFVPRAASGSTGEARTDVEGPPGVSGAGGADNAPRSAPNTAANPPAGAAATQTGGIEPPRGWTEAEKKLWQEVTPPVRAAIARREADFHREITRHDELRNLGNEFARTANEYAPLIQQLGMSPPALFRQYLDIIRGIQNADPQQRAAMFRDMALRNGADPRAFSGSPAGGPARPGAPNGAPSAPVQSYLPPEIQRMAREWQDFRRQQEEYQQRQAEAERVRQEQEERETASEIDIFRSRPEHAHFEAVKDLMASLLRGGVAQTLEEAYQSAIWAHPQIRAQLERERADAAANAARQRREAERARAKSGSVRGSRGSVPEAQTGSRGSVREDIRAAMEAVGGGRV